MSTYSPPAGDAAIVRAQRAARRGLEALKRAVPSFTDPGGSREEPWNVRRERRDRAHLEVLDAGRTLIAAAGELEQRADVARRAGVEALRFAWPAESWAAIGELLGVSGQAAHKRFRDDVEAPEAQRTIDDELAEGADA